MSIEHLHTNRRMSRVVIHNDTVYLAGLVADEPVPDDPAAQTRSILERIDGFLAEAGSDKRHLLSATIWLSDMAHYDAMNSVWDAWVPEGCAPGRACVEAKLAHPKYKVEIRVIAAVI